MSEDKKLPSSSDKKLRRKREKKPLPVFLRVLGRIFSFILGVIATILAIFIITGCIVGVSLTTYVMSFVDVEQSINLRDLDLNYTTILYANDPDTGNTYELKRLQGEENRIWVDLENIPQHVIDALISVEDERINQHNEMCIRDSPDIAVFPQLLHRDADAGLGVLQLVDDVDAADLSQPLFQDENRFQIVFRRFQYTHYESSLSLVKPTIS